MKELMTAIQNAIEVTRAQRDQAGRGEEGRYLSLAVTALEEAEGWARRTEGLNTPRATGYPSDEQIEEARERGRELQG